MDRYTHTDRHTQSRRLSEVFKKAFTHKIFNQNMIQLRRETYNLGHGWVHPSIEQIFMERVCWARHCARFWGTRQSPTQGTNIFSEELTLDVKDEESSHGRSWGKSFPAGCKSKSTARSLASVGKRREDQCGWTVVSDEQMIREVREIKRDQFLQWVTVRS